MHRKRLTQQIETYRNRFPLEAKTADRFIDFVTTYEDCFKRSLEVGHVTGSAWVMNGSKTHVLLTHHRKLNKWLQLGGHADGEGDIRTVARREAQEESGIEHIQALSPAIFDMDIHLIPERKTEPAHYHYDLRYLFYAPDTEDYIVSDESHDLAWIDVDHIRTVTEEPSMLRMTRKWKTGAWK